MSAKKTASPLSTEGPGHAAGATLRERPAAARARGAPLPAGSEWSVEAIAAYDEAIGRVAADYGLDCYRHEIEIISAEQMMDAYASIGMPVYYNHWSFGKHFLATENRYKRGQMGLAYEIVINSDPCIAYLMDENTLPMQALVIAHAAYGHNSFFKGNHLFKQWTSADAIIDYLVFARHYIAECEERHGVEAVERILDACHALLNVGVDRYKRSPHLSLEKETLRQKEREAYLQAQVNDLWRTLPPHLERAAEHAEQRFPPEPEENLLYFIEKNAPLLEPWQREVVRIARKIGQYFYPQRQTQVMNEGWACFWHYTRCTTRARCRTASCSNSCSRTPTSSISRRTTARGIRGSTPTRSASPCGATCGASARRRTTRTARGSPTSPAATGAKPSTSRCATSRTRASSRNTSRRA